ncbi:hypothetical protein KSW81_006857 [Nannochloris sp. 'desiccata']|nr:hypothetical protein KSW81_006857 [Chlorella desiccata (nom. nud.)]
MKLPGILVVGERPSEIEALVNAIRSDQSGCTSASDSLWTIDNKYYTAQVAISILTATNENSSFHLPSHIHHQAVVAVFNAAVDTLDTMQRLWGFLEDHDHEFETKLAVVLCIAGIARPHWLEQADAWFAEHCTELVVVEEFERVDAPRLAPAAEGGLLEGMERVVEALQAHVWPGMQRKCADKECIFGGASDHEPFTAAEPSIAALLQQTFLQEDSLEDNDEADKLFAEVLGQFSSSSIYRPNAVGIDTGFELFSNADFRQKMCGASRRQRTDAAAELVTRLHALMGENSEASGSIAASDEEQSLPTD